MTTSQLERAKKLKADYADLLLQSKINGVFIPEELRQEINWIRAELSMIIKNGGTL